MYMYLRYLSANTIVRAVGPLARTVAFVMGATMGAIGFVRARRSERTGIGVESGFVTSVSEMSEMCGGASETVGELR